MHRHLRHTAINPHSLPPQPNWNAMHAEVPAIPPVIDVDAELDHWRRQHADGALSHNSFGSYVPWIKFACDSLITQPRASNAQRDETFQTQYALQIMPRLSEAQAREFVYQTSRVRLQDAPRLRA